jgi:thioredoxin 1
MSFKSGISLKTGGRRMAKRVSKDDFEKEVLQSELPVIVDFYSDSCKQLSPILGDIEDDYEDKAKVVKVNINFDEELMEKYEVMASPTLVFFKDGEETDRTRGLVKKAEIEEKLGALL